MKMQQKTQSNVKKKKSVKDMLKEDPFVYYFGHEDPSRKKKAAALLPKKQVKFDQQAQTPMTSEFNCSSDEDDKNQSQFWQKDEGYYSLPKNVRNAISISKQKQKHSEFYYKLKHLNDRINIYTKVMYDKVPAYQQAFL